MLEVCRYYGEQISYYKLINKFDWKGFFKTFSALFSSNSYLYWTIKNILIFVQIFRNRKNSFKSISNFSGNTKLFLQQNVIIETARL